jgi:glycine cleavage system H protein
MFAAEGTPHRRSNEAITPTNNRISIKPRGELSMTTLFTPDHEWINIEDHDAATVGITLHAQDALGDVVFVDLPEVGATLKQGDAAGVVESVKAAADVKMPVSGEIVEVNEALRADPSLANSDPMGQGWFFKVKVTDMAEFDGLMDPPGYDALLKTL